MKKSISLLLILLLSFSVVLFTGCGTVNDTEVSVLWAEEATTINPNSLLNSMDRAMYIEKVSHVSYGAKGDADTQLQQAKDAVDKGCAVLVVELISPLNAAEIVDYAKAKNIPVVFINTNQLVPQSVVSGYDKCAVVTADMTTIAEVKGRMTADYVKANFKKLDKNKDGKITYYAYGLGLISTLAVQKANDLLKTEDYKVKDADKNEINTSLELADVGLIDAITGIDPTTFELILTADDVTAFEVLKKLQEKDYNTDKLTTQFVPVMTVGNSMDYKAYVAAQGKENFEANKYLVDLTGIKEKDLEETLAEMIYTTGNVISTGRLSGTVIADDDAIAGAVAQMVRNLVKGKDVMDGVASKVKEGETPSVSVDGQNVLVRYIPLTE